ncbi:hypothetical protein GCM10010398_63050 [Streptomyces fimbriatus]
MGPTVWEEEGPMPMEKRSKTLTATESPLSVRGCDAHPVRWVGSLPDQPAVRAGQCGWADRV